jgi:ABC-type amino acid transport substrate-binding protein
MAIALALLVSSSARANAAADASPGRLPVIRERGKLLISVKNHGPDVADVHRDPAHFQKRAFELELAYAIGRRVFGVADPKIAFKQMPRPQRLQALANREVDLVISMLAVPDSPTPPIRYSHPYLGGALALMAKPGRSFDSLRALAGTRVGAVRESVHDPGAELAQLAVGHGLKVDVVYFGSFTDAALALDKDEIVAVASLNANVDAFIVRDRRFVRAPLMLAPRAFAVAVRDADDDLLALVNDVIDDLRRRGELERMAERARLSYLAPPR